MKIHQSVKKRKFASRMKLWLSYKAGKKKKIEVWEKKGSVKIWELDSNNRDVDRDSDESDINESMDSLTIENH